jgi:hypothetical protein
MRLHLPDAHDDAGGEEETSRSTSREPSGPCLSDPDCPRSSDALSRSYGRAGYRTLVTRGVTRWLSGPLHPRPVRYGGDAGAATRWTSTWTQLDRSRLDGPAGAGGDGGCTRTAWQGSTRRRADA